MTDINALIAEMVQAKTFGLEAVEAVKALRDENEELKALNQQQTITLNRSAEQNQAYRIEIEGLTGKVKELEQKIQDDAKTVETATHQRYMAEKNAAVAHVYKECFETVFRPSAIRETIQRNVAVPTSNAGGGIAYPTIMGEDEKKTIENV